MWNKWRYLMILTMAVSTSSKSKGQHFSDIHLARMAWPSQQLWLQHSPNWPPDQDLSVTAGLKICTTCWPNFDNKSHLLRSQNWDFCTTCVLVWLLVKCFGVTSPTVELFYSGWWFVYISILLLILKRMENKSDVLKCTTKPPSFLNVFS